MHYTTLNRIHDCDPCTEGWKELLSSLDKTTPDDEPLSLLHILESNGLDNAIWALRAIDDCPEIRLFAVRCMRESCQHLFKDHERVLNALDVAEWYAVGEATDDELQAAWQAARKAAWYAAWWYASGYAEWCSTRDATRDASRDAAGTAAWHAAGEAAWYAAGYAAGEAAREAAGTAAGEAARDEAWDAEVEAAVEAAEVAWDDAWDDAWTADIQKQTDDFRAIFCSE